MATVAPSPATRPTDGLITWSSVATGDTCTPIQPQAWCALAATFQVTGTVGTSTVVLQRSNDGSNWATVKDTSGTDISLTAAGCVDFSSAAPYLRPNVTGGTATGLTCTIYLRG